MPIDPPWICADCHKAHCECPKIDAPNPDLPDGECELDIKLDCETETVVITLRDNQYGISTRLNEDDAIEMVLTFGRAFLHFKNDHTAIQN